MALIWSHQNPYHLIDIQEIVKDFDKKQGRQAFRNYE